MTCALRKSVYAILLVSLVHSQNSAARDNDGKKAETPRSEGISVIAGPNDHFPWDAHRKLSWDDFRGAINASTSESAAATHCGIGFKTNTTKPGHQPEIIVYNTFYAEKSWVKSDAKIPSILDHEQGHFDLCEIFTRKLRSRMNNFDFNVPDVKQALMNIYSEISNEYEKCQQAYERETTHGTNIKEQKRWQQLMASQLI